MHAALPLPPNPPHSPPHLWLPQLARFANDATRLSALAALELLALNLPDAADKIGELGGGSLRQGLSQHGSAQVREMVRGGAVLEPPKKRVAVDARAHAKLAKQARIRHSRLGAGRSQVGIRRAYHPAEASAPSGSEVERSTLPFSMVGTAARE